MNVFILVVNSFFYTIKNKEIQQFTSEKRIAFFSPYPVQTIKIAQLRDFKNAKGNKHGTIKI